jgi:hypothetical protein
MIPEDGEGAGSEGVSDPSDVAEAIVEVASRVVGKVSGDHGEIMGRAGDDFDQAVGEAGHAVDVQIGEMEQAEAVETWRQVGQWLLAGDGADVEAVGAPAFSQSGEAEQGVDHAVDRHDALDDERAFALMDKAGTQVGLALEALAEEGRSEPGGQPAEIGRVVRHGRLIRVNFAGVEG